MGKAGVIPDPSPCDAIGLRMENFTVFSLHRDAVIVPFDQVFFEVFYVVTDIFYLYFRHDLHFILPIRADVNFQAGARCFFRSFDRAMMACLKSSRALISSDTSSGPGLLTSKALDLSCPSIHVEHFAMPPSTIL